MYKIKLDLIFTCLKAATKPESFLYIKSGKDFTFIAKDKIFE